MPIGSRVEGFQHYPAQPSQGSIPAAPVYSASSSNSSAAVERQSLVVPAPSYHSVQQHNPPAPPAQRNERPLRHHVPPAVIVPRRPGKPKKIGSNPGEFCFKTTMKLMYVFLVWTGIIAAVVMASLATAKLNGDGPASISRTYSAKGMVEDFTTQKIPLRAVSMLNGKVVDGFGIVKNEDRASRFPIKEAGKAYPRPPKSKSDSQQRFLYVVQNSRDITVKYLTAQTSSLSFSYNRYNDMVLQTDGDYQLVDVVNLQPMEADESLSRPYSVVYLEDGSKVKVAILSYSSTVRDVQTVSKGSDIEKVSCSMLAKGVLGVAVKRRSYTEISICDYNKVPKCEKFRTEKFLDKILYYDEKRGENDGLKFMGLDGNNAYIMMAPQNEAGALLSPSEDFRLPFKNPSGEKSFAKIDFAHTNAYLVYWKDWFSGALYAQVWTQQDLGSYDANLRPETKIADGRIDINSVEIIKGDDMYFFSYQISESSGRQITPFTLAYGESKKKSLKIQTFPALQLSQDPGYMFSVRGNGKRPAQLFAGSTYQDMPEVFDLHGGYYLGVRVVKPTFYSQTLSSTTVYSQGIVRPRYSSSTQERLMVGSDYYALNDGTVYEGTNSDLTSNSLQAKHVGQALTHKSLYVFPSQKKPQQQ